MSRCSQLRQEAVQVRGRIDRGAGVIHQRIDRLMHQVRVLARNPAALPVAFICGFLAERLPVPDIKHFYGLLAGQVNVMQIASLLIGPSPVR